MIGKRCFGGELEKYRPIPIEESLAACASALIIAAEAFSSHWGN
jgi:hypothetical protein